MNISVLIPVHKFNDEISELLKTAIKSVNEQEKIEDLPSISLICPKSIEKELIEFLKTPSESERQAKINVLVNDGETDFQSQINFGVSKIENDYFSILEFDDEYSTTYFYNVLKNMKFHDDVDFFLPMIVEVNDKNETMKLTNEIIWAQQFVGENGEMGVLNQGALSQYTDFKISGGVFNKDEYEGIGKLKKNIKLTFNYEFLLRALNNACKVYVIPKIGYKHFTNRSDSLFDYYKQNMPVNERNFWFETALKESNFTSDREIDMSNLNKQ